MSGGFFVAENGGRPLSEFPVCPGNKLRKSENPYVFLLIHRRRIISVALGCLFYPAHCTGFVSISINNEDDFFFRHCLDAIQVQIGEFLINTAAALLPFAFNSYSAIVPCGNEEKFRFPRMIVNGGVGSPFQKEFGPESRGISFPIRIFGKLESDALKNTDHGLFQSVAGTISQVALQH